MSISVVDRKYNTVYRKFIAAVAALMLLTIAIPHHVKAFSDVSSMTDADFFGVWNGSAWTTAGKINYSYSPNLATVENYAKQGNYTSAKAALLTYYKNRTSRTVPAFKPESRNTNLANLSSDNILTGSGDRYLDTVTLTNTYQTVSSDVTGVAQDALQTGGNISFLLMARYKEASASLINSREQSANKPTLDVVVGGQTYSFTANKDTYTRPGAYGDTNYGTAPNLVVKDSGDPPDEYTRRAYINFDISSLPTTSTITSATLKLYGKHQDPSGTKDIMVYFTGDTVWGENTLTWNTTKGMTFSWQGIATGPDWNQPASGADDQYLFLISRFGYLSSIVQEYTVTSDEYYASNALRLMLDLIQDKEKNGDYPQSLDVAIRAKNWVTAYHYLVDSSSMDKEANTALLKYFWRMANFLGDPNDPNAYHPINNWAVSETTGLYMMATYFPEFVKSTDWTELAKTRFDYLATTLLNIDGSYVEASSNYTYGVLASFNSVKEFANLNSLSLNPSFETGVLKLAKYIVDMMLPDGWDPQYGDSDYTNVKPIVLKTGELYDDANLKYFGSGGTTGTAPSYTSTLYAGGSKSSNIAFMRSGWTANDLYMNVNGGWGGHGHPDYLAVNAYAYGQRLLIDPGRYSYADDPIAIWLRRATEAHNTIEINDVRQSLVTQTVKDWSSNDAYDYFRGSSTAYSGLNHVRDVLFVKDKFWIVSDIVTGGTTTNKYQQTWHMLPDAAATMDNTTKKVTTNFSGSANIQVVPADPSSFTASMDSGYYSKTYQSVSSAPYASYVKNVSGEVTFDTVLYPTAASDTNRNVKVTRLTTAPSVALTVATAFKVEQDYGHNGDIGYYYLSHEKRPAAARSFDSYNYDGKMVYVETDSGGNRKSALVKAGKTLKQSATNLINSPYEFNDLGVKWNGATLEISGAELKTDTSTATAIAIYAPSVTTVKLNGTTVSFTRSGDYIYAVKPMKLYYDAQNDFSSTQGQFNWYNQKFDGSTYTDLPVWSATSVRWQDTAGHPLIAEAYQSTASAADSSRTWIAPASGVVTLEGVVLSQQSFATGDGTLVKIMKNGTQVWPTAGWQSIARNERTGVPYRETIAVNAGDAIHLIINRNATIENDLVRFYSTITLFPGAELSSYNFESGTAAGWTPLNAGRWTVGTDAGDYSYYINTSSYSQQSGDRPGEYALMNGSDFTNFEMTLKVKQGDDVTANTSADAVVMFNYQDANNYYYVMFNNALEYVQAFKVKNGVRQLIINSDGVTDWVKDNNYHNVKIKRDSATGRIVVWYDNSIIMDGYDKEFNGGQVGIGSYNDSAYFDDIAVVEVD